MASCYFELNSGQFSTFRYDHLRATAFSGNTGYRNQAGSAATPSNGAIPPGTYWIVDRVSGGTVGPLIDWLRSKDEWFALYREDGAIDDETFVDGVRRGEFRMHPVGPQRLSLGCITFEYPDEFDAVRRYLTTGPVEYIPHTGTRTYGTVTVTSPAMPRLLQPGRAYA
jgi:hypothetical protein